MKRYLKLLGKVFIAVLFIWLALTIWVQYGGIQSIQKIGAEKASKRALVIYNPDPIYSLDKQVCVGFAEGLMTKGFHSTVATVKKARELEGEFDLFVFCANTYNWSPDWQVTGFIKHHPNLSGKAVVAITLGSGSTGASKRKLDRLIQSKGANLIESRSYWLLRPNDEDRIEEKNNEVAVEMAFELGKSLSMD
jgi:hypothetical protein